MVVEKKRRRLKRYRRTKSLVSKSVYFFVSYKDARTQRTTDNTRQLVNVSEVVTSLVLRCRCDRLVNYMHQ